MRMNKKLLAYVFSKRVKRGVAVCQEEDNGGAVRFTRCAGGSVYTSSAEFAETRRGSLERAYCTLANTLKYNGRGAACINHERSLDTCKEQRRALHSVFVKNDYPPAAVQNVKSKILFKQKRKYLQMSRARFM
jgi:hypothetical protein